MNTTNNKAVVRCAQPSLTLRTNLLADPPAPRGQDTRWRRLEQKQRITEMWKSARSKAEKQFAATQKKANQALKEKEKAWQENERRVANLRALRLAKEAADKEAAERANAEKGVAKNKK